MGLTKGTGSLSTTSLPVVETKRAENTPQNVRATPEKRILDRQWTKDTFTNQNALNTDRQSRVIEMLKGFTEGSPIIVTYFHQMSGQTDSKYNNMDVSAALDTTHNCLLQINNFEMQLKAGMSFDYSTSEQGVQSQVTGEAVTYPGFNPFVGDLFVYEIEPGKLGLFKVDEPPTRLTIKTGTSYNISFTLIAYLDEKTIDHLKKSVREVRWFNKQKFLSNDAALLKADEVLILEDINKLFPILHQFYQETFFDKSTFRSWVRPDEDQIYDPYIVEFLLQTLGFHNFIPYPHQLCPDPKGYKYSIWGKLLRPDAVPWTLCLSSYEIKVYTPTYRDVRINALTNRPYMELSKTGFPYFNKTMINMDSTSYSDFDALVMSYLNDLTILPDSLFNLCEHFYDLDPMDQFYRIPVYMFLLTKLKQAIIECVGDIKYDGQVPTFLPIQLPIDNTKVTEDFKYTVDLQGSQAIGVVTNNGTQFFFTDKEVTYTGTVATINLARIAGEYSFSIDNWDWKLITNGGTK